MSLDCLFPADLGGLLALFLGASAVTCLEVIDLVVRLTCRSCRRRQHRKHNRRKPQSSSTTTTTTPGGTAETNHVTKIFRSEANSVTHGQMSNSFRPNHHHHHQHHQQQQNTAIRYRSTRSSNRCALAPSKYNWKHIRRSSSRVHGGNSQKILRQFMS